MEPPSEYMTTKVEAETTPAAEAARPFTCCGYDGCPCITRYAKPDRHASKHKQQNDDLERAACLDMCVFQHAHRQAEATDYCDHDWKCDIMPNWAACCDGDCD